MDATQLAAVLGNVKPETFMEHWRKIRELKDEQAELSAAIARAKKAAKGDGIDLEAVALLERLCKMDDDELQLRMRKLFVYSDWIKMPLAEYAEGITPPAPKQETNAEFDLWQVQQNGLAAGKTGTRREDNPYDAGSEKHVAWDKAWGKGFRSIQGQRARELAKNAAAKETRKSQANGHAEA
jgi:uncharacterized protein (UPF0335 family)